MGLDTVELVMAVEEHFDIRIDDGAAAAIYTVGLLHAHVLRELAARGDTARSEAQVFSELRELICHQLGVRPDQVVPEARFVQDLGAD
jgi:acyl carrier protein